MDRFNWAGFTPADELFRTIKGRFVMAEIEMLAVVALLQDLPEHNLVRGQVGTVGPGLGAGYVRGRVQR